MRTLAKREAIGVGGGVVDVPLVAYLCGGDPAVCRTADAGMRFQEAYPNTAIALGLTFVGVMGGAVGAVVSAAVSVGLGIWMDDGM